ncbi:hypothetical protein A1O1_04612 [Capronia coronata CBS 617.96]|uniref:Uncharacterized protein n=1 Tax=Capronia coronata CBS 617.96 TaxID=1182541 RepID=W9Y584_9EURO|nr:uncharacterized protein A1O1_04612 [Capronia coronata CBS 617.96]EXJ87688.1 hypothetical protein A1O1_04612 [Capronia coronata CBS 617.96]
MNTDVEACGIYPSIKVPWSSQPREAETTYRDAGLVKTKGTLFLLPPPDDVLRETFNAPPRPKTRMSAGAVALCKHFERGGASSEHGRSHPFWTMPVGSNENKTEIARQILDDMLSQAVWKNVMLLHHGVAVYEIRNSRGYGIRWTLDLQEKRGARASEDQVESHLLEDDYEKDWVITKTTLRGFLEPIAGLDYELPHREQKESATGSSA